MNTNRFRRVLDVEAGGDPNRLSTVQSETDAGPSPIEARRHDEFGASRGNPGPVKRGTFPQHGGQPPRSRDGEGARPQAEKPGERAASEDATSRPEAMETDQGPSRSVPASDEDTVVDGPVSRHRTRHQKGGRLRKFLHMKHSGEEADPDGRRTDTAESKTGKQRKHIPVQTQLRAVFGSWINLMLVFVPVGIALEYAGVNKIVVFVINFLAIIPLAAMLSYATEELAMYIGETLGGLLNATFGNAVELIVSIIALTQQKILIVQTSLIGSMLSNLLLVLGMCFFSGGIRRVEQFFNLTVAQTAASLLALAIGSLIIPTAFNIFTPGSADDGVTRASRGTAVMLLFVYACYLYFQLSTHIDMYNAPSQKAPKKSSGKKEKGEMQYSLAVMGAGTGAAAAGGGVNRENLVQEEAAEEDAPQLTIVGALATLAGSTVLVALCAEYMVSAINAVATSGVSEEFIGLILLPIVGNAAEHATAVTVAIKDKMDLAIGVAVGSSLQIALLVLPLMVCFNWFGVGSPADLNLSFDGFQVCCLFIVSPFLLTLRASRAGGESGLADFFFNFSTGDHRSQLRDPRRQIALARGHAAHGHVPRHRRFGLVLSGARKCGGLTPPAQQRRTRWEERGSSFLLFLEGGHLAWCWQAFWVLTEAALHLDSGRGIPAGGLGGSCERDGRA